MPFGLRDNDWYLLRVRGSEILQVEEGGLAGGKSASCKFSLYLT